MSKKIDEKPIIFKRKLNCCACTACYNACPVNTISMTIDDEGFYYPSINIENALSATNV